MVLLRNFSQCLRLLHGALPMNATMTIQQLRDGLEIRKPAKWAIEGIKALEQPDIAYLCGSGSGPGTPARDLLRIYDSDWPLCGPAASARKDWLNSWSGFAPCPKRRELASRHSAALRRLLPPSTLHRACSAHALLLRMIPLVVTPTGHLRWGARKWAIRDSCFTD